MEENEASPVPAGISASLSPPSGHGDLHAEGGGVPSPVKRPSLVSVPPWASFNP